MVSLQSKLNAVVAGAPVTADRSFADVSAFAQHASVAVFITGVNGVVRFCNESYAKLLGRTADQTIGKTNAELFGEAAAAAFATRNTQVVRSREGIDSVETFDMKDGRRTYFVTMFPVEADAVGGVIMDVTARLTDHRTFTRQRDTLNTVLEAVNNGVWLVDGAWRTTYVNQAMAKMLGVKAEDAMGKRADQLIVARERTEAAARRERLERGQSITASDIRFVRTDGTELISVHSAAPFLDDAGRFAGAVIVMFDVTEARRIEQQLREAQKLEALGVLAGGIAHDFNNLLTSVLGNVSGLRDEVVSPVGNEGLDLIEAASRRAAELCRQMLAFSGRGAFVVKPIELTREVQSALQLVQASLDKRHVLVLELGADAPLVQADAAQLSQVLLSLVMNATEAIGARAGRITVRTSTMHADEQALRSTYLSPELPGGAYAVLEVIDDGVGMSDETKARLFEPFFSTKSTGRGLGLPAVLGIVRGHRGAVQVTSAPNRGTTVRVLFPLAPSNLEAVRTLSPPPTRASAAKVVLVVDDEALVRSTLRRLLVRGGFHVVEAVDGQDCLDTLARGIVPDVVLLDLSMPRLDGAATLDVLREKSPVLPVVLMSGYAEHELTSRVLARGTTQFVQKPFSSNDVLRCLNRVLQPGVVA